MAKILMFVFLLTSCMHGGQHDSPAIHIAVEAEPPPAFASKQAINIDEFQDHPSVLKWLSYFQGRGKDRFQRYLNRGSQYESMIKDLLDSQGLPSELYYLAMIESGFYIRARSHASACGLWQFMKGTGQRYGLVVESGVDERLDPVRSTIAAAHYLQDLHNVFQSWFLAMAAYNAGESRVMNTIMGRNTRNYWQLVKRKALPKETRNYVPKFIAAVMIGQDPEAYGFRVGTSEARPDLQAQKVPGPIRLSSLARSLNVSSKFLKTYNPHLLKGVTPYSKKSYRVWVPGDRQWSKKSIASLSKYKLRYTPSSRGHSKHRIRSGETLASISRKYRIPIRFLKKVNRLRSSHIYAGKMLKIPASKSGRKKNNLAMN